MKTLKEYSDFLVSKGYCETSLSQTYLSGRLEIVDFIKNGFCINLYVNETKELSDYLDTLEPGTEYQVDYNNYIVVGARIESPICNVADFLTGETKEIQLVSKPNSYNHHTLDLFEKCIEFQKTNLLEHELFIMSKRKEQLEWATKNLIPILEKYNYYVDYDSFFDTTHQKCSSNIRIDFKHPNNNELTIEMDCITGESIIWADINSTDGCIDLPELYGKSKDEVFNILLEKVWKKDELRFGYIYNNNAHYTIDTYYSVLTLFDCLHYKEKRNDIDFDSIPEKYNDLIEDYNKL